MNKISAKIFTVCQRKNVSPDEGKLFSVHAGMQSQTGVLSKWGHNKTEHKRNTYKHCWQNNLKNTTRTIHLVIWTHIRTINLLQVSVKY